MNFKELKGKFRFMYNLIMKDYNFYSDSIMHINKENYIFRSLLNRRLTLDFELIRPNKDYFKIHPFVGAKDVKFTFIIHPCNCNETPPHEDVSTLERFCEILGWNEHNLEEFNTYLDMYNVKKL